MILSVEETIPCKVSLSPDKEAPKLSACLFFLKDNAFIDAKVTVLEELNHLIQVQMPLSNSDIACRLAPLRVSEVSTCTVQAVCLSGSHDAPLHRPHGEASERGHCSCHSEACCMHL